MDDGDDEWWWRMIMMTNDDDRWWWRIIMMTDDGDNGWWRMMMMMTNEWKFVFQLTYIDFHRPNYLYPMASQRTFYCFLFRQKGKDLYVKHVKQWGYCQPNPFQINELKTRFREHKIIANTKEDFMNTLKLIRFWNFVLNSKRSEFYQSLNHLLCHWVVNLN